MLGRAEQLTASTRVAIGYGGREETLDAVARLIRHRLSFDDSVDSIISELTPEEVSHHLYTADLPDPDLIIHTSGKVRLSGFLLCQCAYSEFYFCDVHWPAFRRVDSAPSAITSTPHRRFGGDGAPTADPAEPALQPKPTQRGS